MDNFDKAIFDFILIHADNSLILGQRLGEWCGHGPVLEQDIALTNIALDYIGRARLLYQLAAKIENNNRSEDDLAFLRDVMDFKNVLLVEQENVDFAYTIVRQFFLEAFNHPFFSHLINSQNVNLSEIAQKSIKETTYHLRWCSEWIIRLGDGTELSHNKVQTAVNNLWTYTQELFKPIESEIEMTKQGICPDLQLIHTIWNETIDRIFLEATLIKPDSVWMQNGGKSGVHSEHLGFILSDLQFMQRAYPGLEW
jgi:ring-1,2-phenylacetyl-CoA epoxidase subunit PaaC